MTNRLPQVTAKEAIRVFERLGYVIRRQTGSHCILRHEVSRILITVPLHSGDIKRPLLLGLLRQAEISHDLFRSAL